MFCSDAAFLSAGRILDSEVVGQAEWAKAIRKSSPRNHLIHMISDQFQWLRHLKESFSFWMVLP